MNYVGLRRIDLSEFKEFKMIDVYWVDGWAYLNAWLEKGEIPVALYLG